MIRSVDIRDPRGTHIPWIPNIPELAEPRKFIFKTGLNILWGKNGTGKSTLLKALARVFHCDQSGSPVITEASLRAIFCPLGTPRTAHQMRNFEKAFRVDHDGQPVRSFNSGSSVGLVGGGFDWDFAAQGITSVLRKASSGQTTLENMDPLLDALIAGDVPRIEHRISTEGVNDIWVKRCQIVDKFLVGTGPKGQFTILFDEPERGLDLQYQVIFWRLLRAYAPEVQIIVASHSVFALNIPEANYIEMTPGSLTMAKSMVDLLPTWANESPKRPKPPSRGSKGARVKGSKGARVK